MDLPTFETARMEENIRCSAADDLFRGFQGNLARKVGFSNGHCEIFRFHGK